MSWNRLAELLALLSAAVLWRQAWRASLIKLARSQYVPPATAPKTVYGQLKQWHNKRQERREQKWTEKDHGLLLMGLGLAVAASLIKLATG